MGDVGREVHTEPDGDDEGVAGDDVDGEIPEVHEARHLDDGGGHTEDDDAGCPETAEEDQDSEEYRYERGQHVLVQLVPDNLVRLPVGISGDE